MEASGFCHSCSLNKTLDKIILCRRYFQPDLNEKMSQAELSIELLQNVDELKDVASGNDLALNNLKSSWRSRETLASCEFVEWKTMETSMEDGLLGRAAVGRTSNAHIPWEMSKTHADSSDNFFQFDSLHYGSRQDYIRRLRKASMIKELKEAGYLRVFFQGICSKPFPWYRNPRDLNDEWFDPDMLLIQEESENKRIEEPGDELISALSNVESLCVERSQKDLTKNNNAVGSRCNFLPCQENEAEVMNSGTGVQDRQRMSRRFPPPLHSLRKTSSLLPHKVPLLLLQSIRSKGRLILQEVQVASQMVFQPIRKDGRLQLRLFRNGKKAEQHIFHEKSADVEFTTANLSSALELNIATRTTAVANIRGQPTQIIKDEENYSSVITKEASARNLDSKEIESVQATGEASAAPEEIKPVKEMLRNTCTIQATRANFKVQKLGSRHLGVLQTIQRVLYQTRQHHYNKESQNELIRNVAARALELTLCRAALRNALNKSTTNTNSSNIISNTRVVSLGANDTISRYVNTYEHSFNNERDSDDSTPKFVRIPHICSIRDSQDPSIQQCRYTGNIRQGDEGIAALWEAHCIAT